MDTLVAPSHDHGLAGDNICPAQAGVNPSTACPRLAATIEPIKGQSLLDVEVQRPGQGRNTGLHTHTDVNPASFLKRGDNILQFRVGGENFMIQLL
jgi:hypothetical protein